MIEFLYTGTYTVQDPPTRLLHHVLIYTIADKRSIERLKSFSLSCLSKEVDRAATMDENDLAAATRHVYENMPPDDTSVQEIMITTIVRNMDVYLEDVAGPICTLMTEIGDLGRDVARAARFFLFSRNYSALL